MPSPALRAGQPALQKEFALLGVLALLWGSSYLLISVAVSSIPPLTLIAIRVATALLLLVAVMRRMRLAFPVGLHAWKLLAVQAFCNSIGAWTLLAWGQQYVESALAGVLNSTSPIFVLIISTWITRQESMSLRKLAGTLLGIAGVALVLGPGSLHGLGREAAAQAAVLLSAVLYALAAIHGRRLSFLPPTVSAAGTMLCATACLVPISLVVDRPWAIDASAGSLLAAGLLGTLCTGVALLLYFRVVNTIGSLGVASQSYLRAGVSVLLGILILGEDIGMVTAIGLAAVLAGVVAVNLPERPRSARRTTDD